jgi:hypothetical protein
MFRAEHGFHAACPVIVTGVVGRYNDHVVAISLKASFTGTY